jgi:hypothetical protein
VLAKFGAPAPRPVRATAATGDESSAARLIGTLSQVPAEVSRINWSARAATLGVVALWSAWIWVDVDVRAGDPGSSFLHLVLLPFHEAGHYAIFRWFGNFIMTLGGALGQHLLPIVAGVALLRRGDAFGAALCFWLLGFSTLDMAIYMYDAFDPALRLLDGRTGADSDGHDWQNTFGDLGLLKRARGIGFFFAGLGMAMMAAGLAWAAWILRLQRQRLGDSLFAETEVE